MDERSPEAPDNLCAEIVADAQRQGQSMISRAHAQAAELLEKAAVKAAQIQKEQLAGAEREATRQKQLILATLPVEILRERSAKIEVLLRDIYQRARKQLLAQEGVDYRSTLVALAVEAIRQMSGESFVLRVRPSDRVPLGQGFTQAIRNELQGAALTLEMVDEPAIMDGGLRVENSSGSQVWDNCLLARLERLWPELRRRIARVALGPQNLTRGEKA